MGAFDRDRVPTVLCLDLYAMEALSLDEQNVIFIAPDEERSFSSADKYRVVWGKNNHLSPLLSEDVEAPVINKGNERLPPTEYLPPDVRRRRVEVLDSLEPKP